MKFDLEELRQRNIPRMTSAGVISIPAEAMGEDRVSGEKLLAVADEYFSHFIRADDGKCVGCGSIFVPKSMSDAFRSTFRWGLAHGEAECSACGYPARAVHEIPEIGCLINVPLQYHPEELTVNYEITSTT